MGWTPGSNPSRRVVVDRLIEANRLLKGMDDSVRSVIQQCEEDIASTDCTVQFWRKRLLGEEEMELPPEERDAVARSPYEVRRGRGHQLGWSKVGKDWHLAYREVVRTYTGNTGDSGVSFHDSVEKARPLVDAPRLVKAASIEGLNDFVNELAEFVVGMVKQVQNGLTHIEMKKGGSK